MNCCELWDCGHERGCASRNINADGLMRQLEECQAVLVRERFIRADEHRNPTFGAGPKGKLTQEQARACFGPMAEGAGAPDLSLFVARATLALERTADALDRLAPARRRRGKRRRAKKASP